MIVWDALRLEVGTGSLAAGVSGVHELPDTGARIQTLIEPSAQILPMLYLCNCDLENLTLLSYLLYKLGCIIESDLIWPLCIENAGIWLSLAA